AAMHLSRLGSVLVAFAALERLEPVTRSWPGWAFRLSGETLFIYAFHVVLVYGAGVGLAAQVGPRLPALAAVLCAVLMIIVSFSLALVYRRPRQALAGR